MKRMRKLQELQKFRRLHKASSQIQAQNNSRNRKNEKCFTDKNNALHRKVLP